MKSAWILWWSIVLLGFNFIYATEYWSTQKRLEFEMKKRVHAQMASSFQQQISSRSTSQNISYPSEFLQIADFLSNWQVLDPASPDYGGMIEAESGTLGNVIQTDNTQEAIVVWCQYAQLTGDTITYRPNIDAAWVYIMNYPAYLEEGASGDDYYRDHNCAWALWGEFWFETVYSDTSFRWYADSCAAFMVSHQLQVFTPQSNLNAFVMGWMAGNLYRYAEWRNHSAWIDSSLSIGQKVLLWANTDPVTNLADYTWAMSSGTAVWGLCNSLFAADTLSGQSWIAAYSQYLPAYFDNQSGGAYVWDSAWNVALVNANRAMHQISGQAGFNLLQKILTDTLLLLDVDDDGGITANKNHPPSEDMSWVSAYLNVMGVDYRIFQIPQFDAGVVQITRPDTSQLLLIGDTLSVTAQVANFGLQPANNVQVQLLIEGSQVSDTSLQLPFGEKITLTFNNVWIVQNDGILNISVKTTFVGDENPQNDVLAATLQIPPFVSTTGSITAQGSGLGVGADLYFKMSQRTFTATADPQTGQFQVMLIPASYQVNVHTEYPFQQFIVDSVNIPSTSPPPLNWQTLRADLLLIDDDEGDDYETYMKASVAEMIQISSTDPWNAFYYWETEEKGIFPPSRVGEMNRQHVVWFTGDADSSALLPNELDSLQALQNSGTAILITGKDIAESLAGNPALAQLLHANYVDNSTYVPRSIFGVAGDPISNGLRFSTWGGSGANNQLYDRDILSPVEPALPVFHYLPQDSQVAGIRYQGTGKLVFLGFGIEGIRDNYSPYNSRAELILAVLNWFEGITSLPDFNLGHNILQTFSLEAPYPNPFNSTVQIRFTVPEEEHLKLEIFNLLGERINTLLDQSLPAGKHLLHWNGINSSGKAAASGIYLIHLSGKSETRQRKVFLLK